MGFRFVFLLFFSSPSLSLGRPVVSLPLSFSLLAFLSFSLRGFGPLRSLARSLALFLSGWPSFSLPRQGRHRGVRGPPGPLRGGRRAVRERERGGAPSLT